MNPFLDKSQYLPHVASLAAAILLILVSVNAISSIREFAAMGRTTDLRPQASTPATPANRPPVSHNPEQLAMLHVFGIEPAETAAVDAAPQALRPEALPKSIIKLDIKGLFSNPDARLGHAVIRHRGQDKAFRVGDEIDSNITLHAVYADYAVIANHDRLERLELPDYKAADNKPSKRFEPPPEEQPVMDEDEEIEEEIEDEIEEEE